MHPLNHDLPGPYLPVRVTLSDPVAHQYTYGGTSLYHMTFILLSVSLWNDLADPVFDGVDWLVSRAGPMPFYWPKLLYPYYFSLSLLSVYRLVLWGWSLRTDRVYVTRFQLAMPTSFNNNNNYMIYKSNKTHEIAVGS